MWKGGEGFTKGGAKRHCKVLRDSIQGMYLAYLLLVVQVTHWASEYHKTCYPSSCPPWWRGTYVSLVWFTNILVVFSSFSCRTWVAFVTQIRSMIRMILSQISCESWLCQRNRRITRFSHSCLCTAGPSLLSVYYFTTKTMGCYRNRRADTPKSD